VRCRYRVRTSEAVAAAVPNRRLNSETLMGEALTSEMIAGARADSAVPVAAAGARRRTRPAVTATGGSALVSAMIASTLADSALPITAQATRG
jgi:hypothetical protein